MTRRNSIQRIIIGSRKTILGALALLLLAGCAAETTPQDPPTSAEVVNPQRLVGQWVRLDGGYLLDIRRVRSSGRVEATYRNPRPINVETAELRRDEDKIGVFIELRDAGYPGSYYELSYDEKEDILSGTYFQATQRVVYEVTFVRR